MSAARAELAGSAPKQTGGPVLGPADPNGRITVTVVLRRAPSSPDISDQLMSGTYRPASREQAEALTSADPADVSAVMSFLEQYGLMITGQNLAARTLHAEGTVRQVEAAFGVQLLRFKAADGSEYISHEGPVSIPADLSGVIVAVLGLNQRRVAEPR